MATQRQIDEVWELSLHGNHLALDFVNTVDWRLRDPVELLVDYEALLHWGLRLGVIPDEGEFDMLLSAARSHPRPAQKAHDRALELRETIYRVYAALAARQSPRQGDLDALNKSFAEAVAHAALTPSVDGFRWSWVGTDPWHRVARPVATTAVELLSRGELDRVKQCRDEGCGWIFFDRSSNVSRRWCSMQGCGSRAKMRSQYRRKKAERRAR